MNLIELGGSCTGDTKRCTKYARTLFDTKVAALPTLEEINTPSTHCTSKHSYYTPPAVGTRTTTERILYCAQ